MESLVTNYQTIQKKKNKTNRHEIDTMYFVTQFRAINEYTGKLEDWSGPHISAISWEDAIEQCREEAPYLEVIGVLESEIPVGDDELPDYINEIRFDNLN